MRIFSDPLSAVKEVERDLGEMGIVVHPQTMQDKKVAHLPEYATKEIRGYAFKMTGWIYDFSDLVDVITHFFRDSEKAQSVIDYCLVEIEDRTGGKQLNPGNAYLKRLGVWEEFLHHGKFAYTYSERITPQWEVIINELRTNPDTRQGIINIHSNISPHRDGTVDSMSTSQTINEVSPSADLKHRGGGGRVPCSMYYQLMIREGKLDLIYTMRSCDLLTHFPVDISLALMMQYRASLLLGIGMGTFTYFCGSLHAYYLDIAKREVF